MAGWTSTYLPAVQGALAANPAKTLQLFNASKAVIDAGDSSTIAKTAQDLLWYNVFTTNDAAAKLRGNPYGNRAAVYSGSLNDAALNAGVARFDESPLAVFAIGPYQTSGKVTKPMLTMHTTGDDIIPIGHEVLYHNKLVAAGSTASVGQLPVGRYGHCNFTPAEVLAGFSILLQAVNSPQAQAIAGRSDVQQARTGIAREVGQSLPQVLRH
jgi:hypothetical protein